jgi:H+/gluconate symporter-like permease
VDVVAVNDNGQISPRNLPQKSVITLKKSGEGNSSNSSTTLVIGIVVGVVGTIIFVFIFLYCYHKRKKGKMKEDTSSEGTETKSPIYEMSQSSVHNQSGHTTYAEVCPAEKREALTANPVYSTAAYVAASNR